MNKLLCDNNTVKTHHVNWSDFLRKVGFLDKILIKNNSFMVICDDHLALFASRSLSTLLEKKELIFTKDLV